MRTKLFRISLFFILCIFSLHGLERKHSLKMDVEEVPSPKKLKGKVTRKPSTTGWEDGFVQGILYGWKGAEKTPLTCGCWLINRHATEHFYDLLHDLDTKFYNHDGKEIIAPLIHYLKINRYLLDGTHNGLITSDAVSTSPTPIRPILLSYNAFVENLNRQHKHDFTEYELPYYS